MSEEWRVCPSFPTMMASSAGSIRHIASERPRKLHRATNGYLMVNFWHEGRVVLRTAHTLVADAFHGPRQEGSQIRHLDGDRMNNRPENLAYGTAVENAADRDAHQNTKRGEANGNAKLPDLAARVIRASYAAKVGTQYELADLFGISQAQVWNIVHGMQRKRPAFKKAGTA